MKKYILTIMLFSLGFAGYAQVGIGTASPTLTLEVVGANDNGAVTGVDGVLVPRVNDTDMSSATAGTKEGQMVYNTVAKKFYYWNATAWTVVGGVATSTFRTESGNSISDADIGNYVICTGAAPTKTLHYLIQLITTISLFLLLMQVQDQLSLLLIYLIEHLVVQIGAIFFSRMVLHGIMPEDFKHNK